MRSLYHQRSQLNQKEKNRLNVNGAPNTKHKIASKDMNTKSASGLQKQDLSTITV